MYFLLGDCVLDSSSCIYSHDKTYLPPGRWWEDEGNCYLLRAILDTLSPGDNSAFMPYTSTILEGRIAWASAHGIEMEEVYQHNRELANLAFKISADHAVEVLTKRSKRPGSSWSWRR